MKKFFSLLCLALIAITVFVISCKKDSNNQKSDQETLAIDKAKSWYNQSILKNGSTKSNTSPLWEEAEVQKSKFGEDVVIVPASSGNNTDNPQVGMLTSFLFTGNSTGIKTGNIVKILGDAQAIKNQGQQLILKYKNQTVPDLKLGAIFVYDIHNRYLIGASIKDGNLNSNVGSQFVSSSAFNQYDGDNIANKKLSSSKFGQGLPSTFSTQGEADGENCTNWYWTTWDANTGQVLSETFVGKTCESSNSGSSTTTAASTNAPPPCYESYHYVTKVTAEIGQIGDIKYEGGWQVAALKNLHTRLVDVPVANVPPRPPVTLAFGTLYFGLPVLKANGNNITYEIAQSITSLAVENAEKAAKQAFKDNYMVDAINVIYMNTLKAGMEAAGGRVSDNPGLNIVVPTTDIVTATYPSIFGMGWGCF
ncbi:hypothetical protein [Pedobacter borealis]|uniref:hypothetical protein n=1 Tax=Pedobacter borealis TaxID=475254 RepID=UPI0004939032|nr:hypothetical protein [Pedobacter borealis]